METITIKELKNISNRFPPEFYNIYSYNSFFKNNKIYKINIKNNKQKNIIITENIDNFHEETIIDTIEEYNDKDLIYLDKYGLLHNNFYNILRGLDILEFNWHKNKFYYKYENKKIHFLDVNEKNKLIKYLQYKTDPFLHTPNIYFSEI